MASPSTRPKFISKAHESTRRCRSAASQPLGLSLSLLVRRYHFVAPSNGHDRGLRVHAVLVDLKLMAAASKLAHELVGAGAGDDESRAMKMTCAAAGILGWLCTHAGSGPGDWYAPFCGSEKIQTLGHASKSAMQGKFTFDRSTTPRQRDYIKHWRALAAHCMQSPDNSCSESWKPPCAPTCNGTACKPMSQEKLWMTATRHDGAPSRSSAALRSIQFVAGLLH
jgi:hypothetical protein